MKREKYGKMYFLPAEISYDWVKKDRIEKAPLWCSVDLRDGNQALVEPMGLEEKLEYFQMLVDIGFKEIEVGFPASSETEYRFVRALIERQMIPGDVSIQVLTQAREHIIRRTFEALEGAPSAIVHLYNSTSVAQREQVFGKSKEEVRQLAVEGAQLLLDLSRQTKGNFRFEYSPESFPGTEVEYALEVCNSVLEVWKPVTERRAIINLPTTVQIAMPHVFASQVEFFHKNLAYRQAVYLCVHPHNDRGCGISDGELGLLAGADRVEGTLFGNGERTGNVDIVTMALNLLCHGVDPGLDFHALSQIKADYERLTGMRVGERSPYAGELVFTAFSGSHQDAISKGMAWHQAGKSHGRWDVPYLPIDPADVGRAYESDVIRINSQSGKGGISYVLKNYFGFQLPLAMRSQVGYLIKGISDQRHQELSPEQIFEIFEKEYIQPSPQFHICHMAFEEISKKTSKDPMVEARVVFAPGGEACPIDWEENPLAEPGFRSKRLDAPVQGGGARLQLGEKSITALGNGRLNALNNAIKAYIGLPYRLESYEEHAITQGSDAKAASYVCLAYEGQMIWGVGIHEDILISSLAALEVAANKLAAIKAQREAEALGED